MVHFKPFLLDIIVFFRKSTIYQQMGLIKLFLHIFK